VGEVFVVSDVWGLAVIAAPMPSGVEHTMTTTDRQGWIE
jgi:hypothetical protein